MAFSNRGQRLEGKVAIVTGGATGIGEAVSRVFAQEGAAVVINGLPDDPVDDVVDVINRDGGRAVACRGDMTRLDVAEQCVKLAKGELGGLHIAANIAGTYNMMAPIEEFDPGRFREMTDSHIATCFNLAKASAKDLKASRGCLLATGSETATEGMPFSAPYGGAKGWLLAFVKGLAIEFAPHGARANIVSPGPTLTQWHDTGKSSMDEESEKMTLKATPLGRHAHPVEIARVFAFLASDDASFVTGAEWKADGGISIARGTPGEKVPDEHRRQPAQEIELLHQMSGMENMSTETRGL